jgi:hypothetical protein
MLGANIAGSTLPMPLHRSVISIVLCLASGLAVAGGSPLYGPPLRLAPQTSGDGAIGDQFGRALVLDGNTLAVGARQVVLPSPLSADGVQGGAVYLYEVATAGFSAGPRLAPPDQAEDDLFGEAIALRGDLLVVGAPGADRGGLVNRGAAYVYRRSGADWVLLASLAPPQGAAEARFGSALAVLDDATVAVAAPQADAGGVAGAGTVHVFRELAGNWTVVATLNAPLASAGDQFGSALAVDGGVLLVGVPRADAAGLVADAGAVDVFATTPGFAALGRVFDPQPVADARFGSALAIDPDRVVIGAPGTLAGDGPAGSVRVFARTGGVLSGGERLRADDATAGDGFGFALDIDGDTLLVGAPVRDIGSGAGYVFVRTGGAYVQRARLVDPSIPEGGGLTGITAVLSNGLALLGADLAIVLPNRAQGAVRVWRGADATWTPGTRLDRGDGAAGELFGFALAVDGPWLAVGSFLDDTATGGDDAGSVALWRRGDAGLTRVARVLAADGAPEDQFGRSVALSGDYLLVGAPRDITGSDLAERGSAYLFQRTAAGAWEECAKLVAPDGLDDDGFGFSVAMSGSRLLVAAPGHDAGETDRGAAYSWRVQGDCAVVFEGKLNPASASIGALAGIGLALDGDRAALGAPQAAIAGRSQQGQVSLFEWNGSAWIEGAPAIAADGAAGDRLGASVALAPGGLRLAAGAPGVDLDENEVNRGAAYVFRLAGTVTTEARLQAAVPQTNAGLGSAIALRDDRLLVGASGEDTASIDNLGRVHLWTLAGTTWSPAGTLEPDDGSPQTFFGRSIAFDGVTAVVGGPFRSSVNPSEGSAWVYADLDRLLADSFE